MHAQCHDQNAKLLEIYVELQTLKLASYPNAIAVLLRVFMEMSVDHYLEARGISLSAAHPNPNKAGQTVFKTLAAKVKEAKADMIGNGADKKDFLMIDKALSDPNDPLSTDLQHAYVHNRFFAPNQRDLVLAWDNAQPFFSRIWP